MSRSCAAGQIGRTSATSFRFTARNFTIHDLIEKEMLTEPQTEQLAEHVQRGDNLLISGATSSGKSTLLNVLAGFIPDRIAS